MVDGFLRKCVHCGKGVAKGFDACPFCNQALPKATVEPDQVETIEEEMDVKQSLSSPYSKDMTPATPATVSCPACGEAILVIAKKCKHCATYLAPSPNFELLLLAIPVASSVLVIFCGFKLSMFFVSSAVVLLTVLTILATALVAAMETNAVDMTYNKSKRTYDAVTWFFAITFLWVVCYPAYLYKRRQYGLRNRLRTGLLVAAVFVGSTVYIAKVISYVETHAEYSNEAIQYFLKNFPK